MEIRFRTRRLRRCAESSNDAIRAWGPDVGPRYMQRIRLIAAMQTSQEMFEARAFDFHPLTGNRRGQYALRLTGQMLVVVIEDERTIRVEEVIDYHG